MLASLVIQNRKKYRDLWALKEYIFRISYQLADCEVWNQGIWQCYNYRGLFAIGTNKAILNISSFMNLLISTSWHFWTPFVTTNGPNRKIHIDYLIPFSSLSVLEALVANRFDILLLMPNKSFTARYAFWFPCVAVKKANLYLQKFRDTLHNSIPKLLMEFESTSSHA